MMKKVIKYMKPRVVKIECPEIDRKGTGFILSENGYLATNFHVIGDVDQNGQVTYVRKILISGEGLDNVEATIVHDISKPEAVFHDYAILKIERSGLDYFELGGRSSVEEGDVVFFAGFPLTQRNLTSHHGHISSIHKAKTRLGLSLQEVLDVDGTVVGGNSGGPLLLEKGDSYEVVGIISQQVASLSEAFLQLEQYLKVQMTNPTGGAVFISGVNPNAALFETIKILKANISTGIGTAIAIDYLKQEFDQIQK